MKIQLKIIGSDSFLDCIELRPFSDGLVGKTFKSRFDFNELALIQFAVSALYQKRFPLVTPIPTNDGILAVLAYYRTFTLRSLWKYLWSNLYCSYQWWRLAK